MDRSFMKNFVFVSFSYASMLNGMRQILKKGPMLLYLYQWVSSCSQLLLLSQFRFCNEFFIKMIGFYEVKEAHQLAQSLLLL